MAATPAYLQNVTTCSFEKKKPRTTWIKTLKLTAGDVCDAGGYSTCVSCQCSANIQNRETSSPFLCTVPKSEIWQYYFSFVDSNILQFSRLDTTFTFSCFTMVTRQFQVPLYRAANSRDWSRTLTVFYKVSEKKEIVDHLIVYTQYTCIYGWFGQ